MLSKLSTGYPVDSGALLMVFQKKKRTAFLRVNVPLYVNRFIIVLFLDLLIYPIDLFMSLTLKLHIV